MDVPTHDEMMARLDSFLERHAMSESRLSRDATGEPGLIAAIRKGRSPTLDTLNKLKDYMARKDKEARAFEFCSQPPGTPPPPIAERENELPFGQAPVSPTGGSSPTCSPTIAPSPPSAASASSRSCSGKGS